MTFYVWKCCEVNASRKSFPFHEIIWFEFNIHPVCWNWYNFLNPVAGVWTFIWTCQVCHQYLISFRINLLNCYVIIIIVRVKLIKMKGLKNCTSKPDKLHLGIYYLHQLFQSLGLYNALGVLSNSICNQLAGHKP